VVERFKLETKDGFKFYRDDGSWLLIRFSGTEALLRIYVEARSPEDVEALLAEGRRIATEPVGATAGTARTASA
jgi:phosphomannomutase